jgi:hypothetical protein
MLVRFDDLLSLKMKAEDGSSHQIRDLLLDETALTAEYVVVDVGGWMSHREVIVGLDRFGDPDIANSGWPARLLRSEVEGKSEPGEVASDRARDGGGAATRLGPIGGPASATPAADLRSAEFWIHDSDVVAEDGPVGKLLDIILETGDWRVRHLVVGTEGSRVPRHQRVVPVDSIARVAWGGRAIALGCPAARIHESPDLHEFDGLSGKWYNRVLAYYGIT